MGVHVVTGATSGIGLSIAGQLADEGHEVLSVARRLPGCPARTDGILHHAADVTVPAEVAALAAFARERFGRIDGLVNAAGMIARAELEAQSLEDFERVLQVNLMGTVSVTKALLPLFRRPGASIVNVTSSLLARPARGLGAYVASKGAVLGFTRALALELAPEGIRVNAVSPGLVRSAIWTEAGMPEEAYRAYLAQRAAAYPLGRVGEPEDVAEAVRYLLSPAAAWVTGTELAVEGGITVAPPAQ